MTEHTTQITRADEVVLAEHGMTVAPELEAKPDTHHYEQADDILKRSDRDVEFEYNDQETEGPRTGLRRMLKRNPSYTFVRELAIADQEPLDPPTVKRISLTTERQRSMLILS